MVRRLAIGLLLAGVLFAQDQPTLRKRSDDQSKPQGQTEEQEPPEEDESLKPKTYSFNSMGTFL